ncbi:MAG: hypothetical protein IPM56_03035 [Ignavibacteriales bacterium]|nr:MAG: hypothetical protein IPM56_03035 [Ignavibacteriales bacterium]
MVYLSMNWYSIKLTHKQIERGCDKKIIDEFRNLYIRLNIKEGMALYRDNHKLHHYQYYYFRVPDSFPFDPLKIFSHNAEVNRTFPPAIMMLEPIEGDY